MRPRRHAELAPSTSKTAKKNSKQSKSSTKLLKRPSKRKSRLLSQLQQSPFKSHFPRRNRRSVKWKNLRHSWEAAQAPHQPLNRNQLRHLLKVNQRKRRRTRTRRRVKM